MPIKRIVPSGVPTQQNVYTFADGPRRLEPWEQRYLEDVVVEKATQERFHSIREMTYIEWLEQVYSSMQIGGQIVGEIQRQRISHFTR